MWIAGRTRLSRCLKWYILDYKFRMNRTVRTYPGSTGKDATAIDEWIEFCNRDFSLLPAVRTLLGMCRQGNFIGLTKRCKRVHEMFYGVGKMLEREVYRSGTGSKGNQTPEKQLLYQFWNLYLGDVAAKLDPNIQYAGRQFDPKFVTGLEGPLKPFIKALKRQKLEEEMKGTSIVDSSTQILNGIANVYRNIYTTTA